MDKKIFDRLTAYIVENQNRFYRLAYSYVRNREDALDAVQSAVCRALEYGGGLHGEAVKTWFYRILVNECLRMIKERERFLEAREEEEIPYEEKSFEPADDLDPFLSRLDQDTRTIIKLRFFEEMTIAEISRITGLKLNTVKAKLYRGLKQLRITMKEAEL